MLISYKNTRDEIVKIISFFRIIVKANRPDQNLRMVQQVIFSLSNPILNHKSLLFSF